MKPAGRWSIETGFVMANTLEQDVRELQKKLAAISAQPFTVFLTTMPEPFILLKDVPVLIQPTGDDFVATLIDAGISATGDTEVEAAWNLKDIMVQKFIALESLSEQTLGKSPKRQLAVLKMLIRQGE